MDTNEKSPIIIGVGGVARAGKNLFCDILINILKSKHNLYSVQFALADELKQDCAEFIRDKFGLDVFTEKTEEKKVFRDMLVWYGDAKRKQTNGRYWIDKLNIKIGKEMEWGTPIPDVIIISDIRYDVYEMDEVDWVQKELRGTLFHVKKYHRDISGSIVYTEPVNEHEKLNDPRLQDKADCLLEWDDVSKITPVSRDALLTDFYLNDIVERSIIESRLL